MQKATSRKLKSSISRKNNGCFASDGCYFSLSDLRTSKQTGTKASNMTGKPADKLTRRNPQKPVPTCATGASFRFFIHPKHRFVRYYTYI